MKTSRKYIIVLIIVIFIAAFAFLYMTYNKQKNENTLAQQNLTNAQTTYNTALKNKAAQEEFPHGQTRVPAHDDEHVARHR